MKKLNLKLLLILIFGTISLAIAVHFVHDYQVARNADGLLTRANQARTRGDLEGTVRNMQRYMKHRPEDTEQLVQLALDMKRFAIESDEATIKDIRQAYSVIDKAVRESPDDGKLRREAADFAMQIGRHSDAVDHLKALRAIDAQGLDAELEIMLARCHVALGDHRQAVAVLGSMIGYDPETGQFTAENAKYADTVDAYVLLALLYRDKILDNDKADRVMDQLVAANADSFEAYLQRSRYGRESGSRGDRLAQAAADIVKALDLAPDDPDVILAAAQFLADKKKFQLAQNLLERGLQLHPEKSAFYQVLCQLAQRQGQSERALEYVDRGLKTIKDDPALLWTRADLELRQKDFDAFAKTIGRLEGVNYPRERIEYLVARELVLKQQWQAAAQRLEKLRPLMVRVRSITTRIDLMLGDCYKMLGYADRQLEAFRRVVAAAPAMVAAHLGEAEAYLALGRNEEALRKFEALDRSLGDAQGELADRVRATLLQLKVNEQLLLDEDERDWSEAKQLADKVVASEGIPKARKVLIRANLMAKLGKIDAARRVVEEARREFPTESSLWLAQLKYTEREEDAQRLLAEMAEQLGDSVDVRLVRAQRIVEGGGDGAKERLGDLEEDLDQFSAAEKVRLWRGLSGSYYRLGARAETRRLWELVAAEQEKDVRIRVSLFQLAKDEGDEAEMQEALDEIEKLAGRDSEEWKFAQASRLLWMFRGGLAGKESLSEARHLVQEVRQLRPDWSAMLRLEAEILLVDGDVDASIESLKSSLEVSPGEPRVIRRLAQLLTLRGRHEEAGQVLDQLSTAQQTTSDERTKGLLMERNLNVEGALRTAAKIVEEGSKNPSDHLWYARLLSKAGQHDEAEAAARTAVQLAPAGAENWLALVQLLASQGKTAAAEAVVRDAQLSLPENQLPSVLGRCYEALGDFDSAKDFYLRALAADPDDSQMLRRLAALNVSFNRASEATRYLQRLIDLAPPDSSPPKNPDVAWARRTLASQMTASGGYQDFLQGLKLIEANAAKDQTLSPEDLVIWSGLCAARPEPLSHQWAIQALEKARQQRKLKDAERFILAQLYERAERWTETKDITLDLLARQPKNEQILERWLEWLLERNELRQAEIWAKHLPPTSAARIRAEAHASVRRGQSQPAVAKLKRLVQRQLELEPDRPGVLRSIAALLEELAAHDAELFDEAEEMWRDYVRRQPRQSLELAAFLGRRPGGLEKVEEAFQLCEAAAKDVPLPAVIDVGMRTIQAHKGELASDSLPFQRLQQWVDAAEQKAPETSSLMLLRAELESLRDAREAEQAIYRKYLARTDRQPRERAVVLNNLAFSLAVSGEGNESLSMIEEAIAELGPTADLLDTRAMAYLARNEPNKAIADLHRVLTAKKSAVRYFHLALAEHMNGNIPAAVEAFNRAQQLGLDQHWLPGDERQKLKTLKAALRAQLELSAT